MLQFRDALGNIARALIDSSRRVVVALDAITTNRFPFYDAAVFQLAINNTHAAGVVTIDMAASPAGKVQLIDSINASNFTSSSTNIQIVIKSGATTITLASQNTVGAGGVVQPVLAGPWYLNPGELIEVNFSGTLLNDNCQVRIHGTQSAI